MSDTVKILEGAHLPSGKIDNNTTFVDPLVDFGNPLGFPPLRDISTDAKKSGDLPQSVRVAVSPNPSRVHSFTPAHKLPNYYELFYNRVVLTPHRVDLGGVMGVQLREITLENRYTQTATLLEILDTGAKGLELDLFEFPVVLRPLEKLTITLRVTMEGPPVIAETFIFRFQGFPEIELPVTGSRAVLFAFPPDTTKAYKESLSWATGILTAYDGREQRTALKDLPSTTVTLSLSQHFTDATRLDSILWGWRILPVVLPLWHYGSTLTATAYVGDIEILTDTHLRQFRVGDMAAIIQSPDKYEVFTIAEVLPDRVRIEIPLMQTWCKNSLIVPAKAAMLPPSVAKNWTTQQLVQSNITLTLDEPVEYSEAAWDVEYEGYPVLPIVPNFSGSITENNHTNYDEVATRTGNPEIVIRSEVGHITREYKWWLKGRENISKFRQFCYNRRGSFETFWVSTWKFDLHPVQPIERNSPEIVIRDTGYIDLYSVSAGHKHIQLRTKRGQSYLREITETFRHGENPDWEVLRVGETFPEHLEVSDVFMISFLGLYRFNSDTINLEWKTTELVESTTELKLIAQGE